MGDVYFFVQIMLFFLERRTAPFWSISFSAVLDFVPNDLIIQDADFDADTATCSPERDASGRSGFKGGDLSRGRPLVDASPVSNDRPSSSRKVSADGARVSSPKRPLQRPSRSTTVAKVLLC